MRAYNVCYRRVGRVAECGGLENRLARKGHGGSNPSLSATILRLRVSVSACFFPSGLYRGGLTGSAESMPKLRVGTIGYGGAFNMGRKHLEELCAHEGVVAEAVCDLDPQRLQQARDDFPGIGTFDDVDRFLAESDVELIVNILPHNLHAPILLQCLEAGRHVVVEKPFAVTVEECDAMIAAAEKAGVMLSTYHNRHWDPNILTIREHLGAIGRPFRWESFMGGYREPRAWWRSDKAISGGVIYDWGAHFCEWMLQVMTGDMLEISGHGINEIWPTSNEDEVEAVVRFAGPAVGSHTASNAALIGKPSIRLLGTEGAMLWEFGNHLDIVTPGKDGASQETRRYRLLEGRQTDYYANVYRHLTEEEPLVITAEWARRVIQVLDFASRAAADGQALPARYA